MGLADGELRGVIAGNPLDQIEGLAAANLDFAHVADVEDSGTFADGFVLGKNAAVFERHVPAAEIDHFCAHAPVHMVQSCFAENGGCRCCHRMVLTVRKIERSMWVSGVSRKPSRYRRPIAGSRAAGLCYRRATWAARACGMSVSGIACSQS